MSVETLMKLPDDSEYIGDAWMACGLVGVEYWDNLVDAGDSFAGALSVIEAAAKLPLSEQRSYLNHVLEIRRETAVA